MKRKIGFVDNAVTIRWRNLKDRISALQHYGMECACCGEKEFSFLSIDHVEGQGNSERARLFGNRYLCGHHMYRWLRRNGFPPGYQTLCMNCQVGRRDNAGECPCQKKVEAGETVEHLLQAFDRLRVGHGKHESTQTAEYRAALQTVMRKGTVPGQGTVLLLATSETGSTQDRDVVLTIQVAAESTR
jgi:hypothetical protein